MIGAPLTSRATQHLPYSANVRTTSRLRRAGGPRHPWVVDAEITVDLPVILDFIISDSDSGELYSVTEGTIDLRNGEPTLVRVTVDAPTGIDLTWTQREFRWSGPIEVVTRIVPAMIRAGQDPFGAEFPVGGFPSVTRPAPQRKLSREFLEDISREYLTLGPGYAKTLASAYQVSPRTVVSWIEKARQRGILTPTQPGRHGGQLQPHPTPARPAQTARQDALRQS